MEISRQITTQELRDHDGTDEKKPIYVAVKGPVFDVTISESLYRPGKELAMFAGKDATRALAKMSKNEEDMSSSLEGLTEKEIGFLDDWEIKFLTKYRVVGILVIS
jgi:membrane-associated progesterone receptor component